LAVELSATLAELFVLAERSLEVLALLFNDRRIRLTLFAQLGNVDIVEK
jgi:hypothetical protein